MYAERKNQWLQNLADPVLGPQLRLMLIETGSEFRQRRVIDTKREALATNAAAAVLIGQNLADAVIAAGSVNLKTPEQSCLILEQLNYWYQEADGGDLTPAIEGAKLKLEIGGEQDPILPEFTLNGYHRGDSALRFGALPLGLVVPPEQALTLTLTPSGTAGGSFDLYVSLVLRLEPLWLMDAAGIARPRN
jgi:hypothetical protein